MNVFQIKVTSTEVPRVKKALVYGLNVLLRGLSYPAKLIY